MRRTINHYSFEYNDREEKRFLQPCRNLDKNIKGVEFEVNDKNQEKTNKLIDELIEKREICSKDTQNVYEEHKKLVNSTLSYDNTVHHEIVLQANKARTIMQKIKKINTFLSPETITNKDGTSMHIHLNRQYLSNENIDDIDMVKAGEAISHVLYNLSGRETKTELDRWVRTRISTLPLYTPIMTRSQLVDRISLSGDEDYVHHPGHYKMINVHNSATVELRIFSNKHNFDYNHSKICLELTDVIVDIAKTMKNLSYSNNYEIPIEIVEDFFNSNQRRRKYYDEIKDALAQTPQELERAKVNILYKTLFRKYNTILRDNGVGAVIRALRNEDIEYDGSINLAHIDEYLDDISRHIAERL